MFVGVYAKRFRYHRLSQGSIFYFHTDALCDPACWLIGISLFDNSRGATLSLT